MRIAKTKFSDGAAHSVSRMESLRSRVIQAADTVEDRDLLEIILWPVVEQKDVRPLADRLISSFGSLPRVVKAPFHLLLEVPGIGAAQVSALKTVSVAAERLASSDFSEGLKSNDFSGICRYLHVQLAWEKFEKLQVLFFDRRKTLISAELIASGIIGNVYFSPIAIATRALLLYASSVIIAHNHTSGNPMPSKDDIEMTQSIKITLDTVAVELLDHIIVGNGKFYSFRDNVWRNDRLEERRYNDSDNSN